MNGTLTLTCDDPRPTAYYWAVVVVFSFAFHILLLLLISLPPLVVSSGDSSERMEVAVTLSPDDIAALEALVRETAAPEAPALVGRPSGSPRAPEDRATVPAQAVPAPGLVLAPGKKAPAAEARTAEPAKKAEVPPENLPPLIQPTVSVADDTAKGQEKPPEDAKYLGATNTEAADRSKKEKIGPDPRIEGETGEVRFSGRRGETENKLAKRDDPQAGSVEKQGTPNPGTPYSFPLPAFVSDAAGSKRHALHEHGSGFAGGSALLPAAGPGFGLCVPGSDPESADEVSRILHAYARATLSPIS
jgi:hypothetical protein